MTIYAYCDWNGCKEDPIPSDDPAGCRVLVGKKEISFHLCPFHQAELLKVVGAYLSTYRPVKC